MARRKVRASNGHFMDRPKEELSCGYIMHQHKKINGDMRWGQLWTGQDASGQNRCTISLFKFNIANPKPLVLARKDLKLKASFEFSEDDFCGLEKGEHYNRHGKKRFICVILKDRHIILQDAIIAMTDGEQDVIGTWYKKITDSMRYLYRWSILGSADDKFLHISKVNMCECFTVHNSNAGQKGKVLLSQLYKTKSIVKIDEYQEVWEGTACTRVTFYDASRDIDKKISLLLEPGKKLSEVLMRNNPRTLAGKFDILSDGHHNLVKVSPKSKAETTKSLKELSVKVRLPERNNYIDAVGPEASYYNNQENRLPGRLPPRDMGMNHQQASPRNDIPPQGFRHQPSNHFHKPAPRHHGDTRPFHGPRDDPKNVTETSLVDSDYHTQTSTTQEISVVQSSGMSSQNIAISRGDSDSPYVNIPTVHYSANTGEQAEDVVDERQPPIVPPREPTAEQVQEGNQPDLIRQALQHRDFIPVDEHPDLRCISYQNHSRTGIAVTISILLERNEAEPVDTSFGLPYSIFRELLLGLEAQSSTRGDWRGLATELGMTFHEVEQIDTAVQNHPQLYAPQIVLLHWQRAEAPFPCTLRNLKKILSRNMGRLDLANLIVFDRHDEEESAAGGFGAEW